VVTVSEQSTTPDNVPAHADEAHERRPWNVAQTRAFFGPKAATWDTKYPDDGPAYAAAVAETAPPAGGVAVDLGCGTGRALPILRSAVGETGVVLGLDVTAEMLQVARSLGRADHAALAFADAVRLPLPGSTVDALFAAGLLGHLADIDAALREFARVTRVSGTLTLFHPLTRQALAARRGRVLREDDPLLEVALRAALDRTGWKLERYDDGVDRFYVRARRAA
jgi:SAM-dependent methyltransferase